MFEYTPISPAILSCEAKKDGERYEKQVKIFIQEKDESLFIESEPQYSKSGDNFTIHCYASKYNFTDSIELCFNGSKVLTTKGNTHYKTTFEDTLKHIMHSHCRKQPSLHV